MTTKKSYSILLSLFLIIILSSSVFAGFEKSEIDSISGDSITVTQVPSITKPLAIDLGKGSFQPNEQMHIDLYISVPCEPANPLETRMRIVNSDTRTQVKEVKFTTAVPSSCFTYWIQYDTVAPSTSGNYYVEYNVFRQDGSRMVTEKQSFNVAKVFQSCPSNSCSDWQRIYSVTNGEKYIRDCVTYNPSNSCSSTIKQESKIVCDLYYHLDGSSCVKDQVTPTPSPNPSPDPTPSPSPQPDDSNNTWLESLQLIWLNASTMSKTLIALVLVSIGLYVYDNAFKPKKRFR